MISAPSLEDTIDALLKGKIYPIGTVRQRRDGKYKKTARGWVKVAEGKKTKTKKRKKTAAKRKPAKRKRKATAKKKTAKRRPAAKRRRKAPAKKKTTQLRGRALRSVEYGTGLKPGETPVTRASKHIRRARDHKKRAEQMLAVGAETVARSHRKAAEAHEAAAFKWRSPPEMFQAFELRTASERALGASGASIEEEKVFKKLGRQRRSWAETVKSQGDDMTNHPSLAEALEKGKKYPLGTVRKRKDGDYKKTARGWVKVAEGGKGRKKARRKPWQTSAPEQAPTPTRSAAKKKLDAAVRRDVMARGWLHPPFTVSQEVAFGDLTEDVPDEGPSGLPRDTPPAIRRAVEELWAAHGPSSGDDSDARGKKQDAIHSMLMDTAAYARRVAAYDAPEHPKETKARAKRKARVGKSAQSQDDESLAEALEKGKTYPIGTVRKRKDGKRYKKTAQGWVQVKETRKTRRKPAKRKPAAKKTTAKRQGSRYDVQLGDPEAKGAKKPDTPAILKRRAAQSRKPSKQKPPTKAQRERYDVVSVDPEEVAANRKQAAIQTWVDKFVSQKTAYHESKDRWHMQMYMNYQAASMEAEKRAASDPSVERRSTHTENARIFGQLANMHRIASLAHTMDGHDPREGAGPQFPVVARARWGGAVTADEKSVALARYESSKRGASKIARYEGAYTLGGTFHDLRHSNPVHDRPHAANFPMDEIVRRRTMQAEDNYSPETGRVML